MNFPFSFADIQQKFRPFFGTFLSIKHKGNFPEEKLGLSYPELTLHFQMVYCTCPSSLPTVPLKPQNKPAVSSLIPHFAQKISSETL